MAASISPLRSSYRICNSLSFHHYRAKLRMHRKCESQRRHLHASVTRHAAVVVSGTEMARQIHREIQREVEELVTGGNMRPHLGVVLVGDDPASRTYVRNKTRAASILGISSDTVVKPTSVSQDELLELIDKMNRDWKVSGLLVQLPLPGHIKERAVCNAIAPEKDVDGFHIVNIGKLCLGQTSMVPATPAAVWEIIRRTGIETVGKNVLVAGRSKNVGLPIAMLLHTDRNHQRPGGDATVTIAHRCTPREQLKELTRLADIVIAAAGTPPPPPHTPSLFLPIQWALLAWETCINIPDHNWYVKFYVPVDGIEGPSCLVSQIVHSFFVCSRATVSRWNLYLCSW
uniref:methenyltetrahydrofolate cyclohydrolase n=1 Tax=Oncorhynchus kisutch TaxID=8019 RepID=A0A8C7IRN9_ONCKI